MNTFSTFKTRIAICRMRYYLVLCIFGCYSPLLTIPAAAKTMVYVANAGDGEIAVFDLDMQNGELHLLEKAKAGNSVMPLAVSPNRQHLYASIRSEPFSVATFDIDDQTGKLSLQTTVPLPDNACYIVPDRTGNNLFMASYNGSKIAVNKINTQGRVQADNPIVIDTGLKAHAVAVSPDNKFVLVTNLGSDQILQLKFDDKSGTLRDNTPNLIKTKVGAGPRHLRFSPNSKFVYVLNELDGTVNTYSFNRQLGTLTEQQSISMTPRDFKGKNWAAEIQLTPNGKFLYASERTSSTLAAFLIDEISGKLTYIASFATEEQPRGFNIDPKGKFLIAVGQKSNQLTVYSINQANGRLTKIKRYPVGNDPNWVEIVQLN